MIGKKILHYKIIEKLGEGGMGVVYKALDTKLNRDVAIKLLPPHLLVSEDDRARFNREAKAAAALHHSNIATVFEINETDGKPFIVMEFVEGKTLDFSIAKAPLKLEDAISIAIQIADGLGAAHKKDVVHRDVKASNILLGEDNKAKILDFGLAKTSMSTKLTQMGTTIGTVAYMSPEQVQGKEVNHRTDLWSLGVLLFEMIAGHLPFKAEYDQAIFYSIQNENPDPLTSVRTGVPMALEWIVNKLMAKDPTERYQSANDLIIDLKAVDITNSGFSRISQTNQTIKTKNPASISKPFKESNIKYPFWIMTFVTIILASTLLFTIQNIPEKEILHVNLAIDQAQKLKALRLDSQTIAISPDGNHIVFTAQKGVVPSLYLRSLSNFKSLKLEGTENASHPFFSPDGKWIAFVAEGKIKRVSILGGGVDVIYDGGASRGACWLDDDTIIFSPSYSSGLLSLSISQGKTKVLTTLDSTKNERTHRWPQSLADGQSVIYTVGDVNNPNSYENGELVILSLSDNQKHILNVKGEMARYVEPGYLLVSKDGTLLAAPFDLSTYQLLSPLLPVVKNVDGNISSGINYYGVSNNGSLVYMEGRRSDSRELVWMDLQGSVTPLPMEKEAYANPKISPDGKIIAMQIGTNVSEADIWLYDIENAAFGRFSFGQSNVGPVWKKDSKGIYYISYDKSPSEVIYKSIDGKTQETIYSFSEGIGMQLKSISHDNRFLSFNVVTGANEGDVMYLDLHAEKKEPLPFSFSSAFEINGVFSPDSKHMAYGSTETGRLEIYIKSFSNTKLKWQVSKSGGGSPLWSPDGKTLYFINDIGQLMAAQVKTKPFYAPGQPHVLMDLSQIFDNNQYDIHPNGKKIVVIRSSEMYSQLSSLNYIRNWSSLLAKQLDKD